MQEMHAIARRMIMHTTRLPLTFLGTGVNGERED